ncbi:regulatory-associated protein of mTOR isoform X2 [Halyomorpha halys]|uniref:regulatory-associated protein of mTOR isoform X2 n=1 Tax=Halyomorpha halys TaxID=286706 RepID=UPI0006D4EDDC
MFSNNSKNVTSKMSELSLPKDEDEELTEHFSDWKIPLAFNKKRHLEVIEGGNKLTQTWRMKERMKTVSVALVICLNVGVDPPDIVKTQPCARLECWIDPLSMSPQKALEAIGNNLQKQYERWQPRARYKQSLDPTVEEVKKLCTSLRRNAKEERVLFHYNGHGVPKPTNNGEIWVFNRMYTQYIPLSIYDLQTWMGAPSIYVYDCSNAGVIVELFKQFADQHEKDYEQMSQQNRLSTPAPNFRNCIQLAACSAQQILPMNPDLPADIFTACLTTPIKIALKWFYMQNSARLMPDVTLEHIDKIPGQLNDRRTMLGELNWIFTAITDTIAWNILPRDLFQKLFRQDLLVASLFRNFLLAERILRSYDCTPLSSPPLPATFQHAMWDAWDLALDLCLAQLPEVLEKGGEKFKHSPFFEEQLTAFSVWLAHGSEHRTPPEQLPIVLQVLLSQVHRLRALELLGKFLDLGPWAVNLALSVGIFPYVLKLLQSSAKELRPLLVFIWAKILAVDSTCQADLVRDSGHKYFISVLQDTSMPSEERMLSVFVLSRMVHNHPCGQEAALQGSLVSICLEQLNDPSAMLRQWLAIALANLWADYDKARWTGVRDTAPEKLYALLKDPVPEVRAGTVYALGTFINAVKERSEHANKIDQNIAITLLNTVSKDMSPLVRKELVVALQYVVKAFESKFLSVALQEMREGAQVVMPAEMMMSSNSMKRNVSRDRTKPVSPASNYSTIDVVELERMKRVSSSSSISSLAMGGVQFGSIYQKLWDGLVALDSDPYPGVSSLSRIVTDYIRDQVFAWPGGWSPPHTRDNGSWAVSVSLGHITVKEATAPREVVEAKASSLPPSPSNRSYLGYIVYSRGNNESTSPGMSSSSDKLISRSVQLTPRPKKTVPNTINEDVPEENNSKKRPLVSTQFVEWCCNYFAQPIMCLKKNIIDVESPEYYRREWRYLKNTEMRKEAKFEISKMSHSRIESQLFSTKCSSPAQAVTFHPYDPHIAIAVKDNITIWDYVQNEKHLVLRGERPLGGGAVRKICSLAYVNPHDTPLLASISDDGSLRVYSTENGNLVTAWPASPKKCTFPNNSLSRGYAMNWDQQRQEFIVGGNSQFLRVWDAERELMTADIPTGADSCVSSISLDPTGGMLMCIGCGDGTVRIYDRRLSPHEARIMTFREHTAWVVNACLINNKEIISGSTNGDVRSYHLSNHDSQFVCQIPNQGLKALAVHSLADVMACGAMSQIHMYRRNGISMNILKSVSNEWFYAPRGGPVGCLEFHPSRPILAAGSADALVSLFSVDNKR